MVNFCAVFGCGSRSERDSVSFFRFPKIAARQDVITNQLLIEKRRHKWIAALARSDLKNIGGHTRICSKHFVLGKHIAG